MKAIALLNRVVVATLLVSASVSAFAGGGGPRGSAPYLHVDALSNTASSPSTGTASIAQGKTRAQVRAELLQAEEAGLIPVHRNDYPPSAETIAHNRVRFQQIEQAWKANGVTTTAEK